LAPDLPSENMGNYHHFRKVAFLGLTSVGKSSLINGVLEKKIAPTGKGMTTKKIKPYPADNAALVLWDFPGKCDKFSYFNANILGLFQAMDLCCVLYLASVNECLECIEVLHSMKKEFVCVLTKSDYEWTESEVKEVKEETEKICSKMCGFKGFYAVSSRAQIYDTANFHKLVAGLEGEEKGGKEKVKSSNLRKEKDA